MEIDKTDNSYLQIKVALRDHFLPQQPVISVLDCFAGRGEIWKTLRQQHPERQFSYVGIDTERKQPGLLIGNNLKYLQSLELSAFDIIDLDAYGIPFEQMESIFQRKYSGVVIFTAIQCLLGAIPYRMLNILGYPTSMIQKCPTLFFRHGKQQWLKYLALRGVTDVRIYTLGRRYYGGFYL